jgi:hypothetical protein
MSVLIGEQGVRITVVHPIKDANLLLVMLNNVRLEFPLDALKRMAKAMPRPAEQIRADAYGAGVHCPALDEHFSLRGYLLIAMREKVASMRVRTRGRRGATA